VSDLQLTEDRDVRGGPGPYDTGTAALGRDPVRGGRARSALAAVSPAALWRRHKLFTFLVILSLLVRVLATRAFRPALLTADSFLYMKDAVQGTLGVIRPSGYSFFLHALLPLHRLLVVTTLQHLMGVAIAVIVYGLLRYHGLPFWGATLAAMPTLFDTRQIALESFILPDTLYCFVIVVAVALLLTKSRPGLWQCGVAGLLLAYAAVLRGNGLPVIVIAVVFMIIRRVGWRALAVGVLAAVIPVAGYVAAYHATYGQYNITSSDGIFLWSRTTSFANCAIIKPAADLKPLCPNLETSVQQTPARAWSVLALLNEPTASDYLWAPDVWWRTDSDPGINAHNDKLGQRFAIAAIKAQPLDYLRAVGRDIALVFTTTDRPQEQSTMTFTQHPHIGVLPPYYVKDLKRYAHTTQDTHAVQPYAYFLFLYQQPVVFGGLLFLFAVLAGLVGMLRNWRRFGGLQALPWVIAAVSIVLPAMLTQSLYRYTIVAIPLACLAAGMAFIRPEQRAVVTAAGPEAAAWTAPGTGPAGTAFGTGAAGAAGAGAVGAAAGTGMAAGAGASAPAVPGWETATPTAEQGAADPGSAESPGPDPWPAHDPEVWAPGQPDLSAWPVPAAEDPDASAWTPPSGTAVPNTSAWATPEVTAPEVAAPEVAAPEVAAPEVATHEVAAHEVAAPGSVMPGATVPEMGAPEPGPAEPEPVGPVAPGVGDPETPGGPAPRPDTSAWAEPLAAPRPAAPPAHPGMAADEPEQPAPPAEPPVPQAADPEETSPRAPDPDISAWLSTAPPAAVPDVAAPDAAAPDAAPSDTAAASDTAAPDAAASDTAASDTSAWAPAAPRSGGAPAVPAPAEAVPDESDWEDSLWEKPAPRTSAPLEVPPGMPGWQAPPASTPAWQAPTTGGPHWQAAGPVPSAREAPPDSPAPAEQGGEAVHSTAAGPSASPSGAVPPVLDPGAAPSDPAPSGPAPAPAESSPPASADES
jgi:hypothetical protein